MDGSLRTTTVQESFPRLPQGLLPITEYLILQRLYFDDGCDTFLAGQRVYHDPQPCHQKALEISRIHQLACKFA